jgi:hypothetical protein
MTKKQLDSEKEKSKEIFFFAKIAKTENTA